MSADSKRQFGGSNPAQQRFLSLFLRSEREIFRCVPALVPNVTGAADIVQQTAMALWEKFGAYERASIETLAQRSGRSEAATDQILQRIRCALQVCVESQARPEMA